MKVGITKKEHSYTPEAYAYKDYLEKYGHIVQLDYDTNLDPNNDINIFFLGLKPFWYRKKGNAIEIHEYQSLSTGSYPKFKDCIKKTLNRKPDKRIFLNQIVRDGFQFNDSIPFLYRDMGIDASFFTPLNSVPEYDIVYCGSISGREGLIEVILKLSQKYNIIVIGDISNDVRTLFQTSGVTMTGRLERKYIPDIYKKCRFGLNYTPDIYPFNIQTSTKTLEYLASGLGIISNRYKWSQEFCLKHNINFHWYENGNVLFSDFVDYSNNVKIYEWERMLESINFIKFISL